MTENRDGWPRHFDLFPHPFKRLGRAVTYFFTQHQLSTHGDHFKNSGYPPDDYLDGFGGAQMLDRELYDKPEPVCIPEGEVIQLRFPNMPDGDTAA